ncbi:hypothetical protein DFQ29_007041 [Apophysomyces sp. BC1021]|nr:hypothetical protein DFQ29_007041 [Apophysomyces sp. BC1021]
MPGELAEGTPLRDGSRLQYKINGTDIQKNNKKKATCDIDSRRSIFLAFPAIQTMMTMGFMSCRGQGLRLPLWVHANFAHLAAASVVASFVISLGAYIASFVGKQRLLTLQGNTGNPAHDFAVGRELNPRLGQFDFKFFTALRPGLVGWLFLDVCMAAKQWVTLGHLTNSMILVLVFQAWYIVDTLWHEESIIRTREITLDGFGFLHIFSNLCWTPMMSSLQARYLADFPQDLNYVHMAAAASLQILGYYIYRSAKNQKDRVQETPEDSSIRDLQYIKTKHGRLLTSGWCANTRHIEYLGQWLISLAWCLLCGFDSVIPYTYTISTAILLAYRVCRDEGYCRDKYGEDWNQYCKQVPYRIIPGIY